MMKTRWRAVVFNNLPPGRRVAGRSPRVIIRSRRRRPATTLGFYLAVALAGVGRRGAQLRDVLVAAPIGRSRRQSSSGWSTLVAFLPSAGLSILVAVAGVGIKLKVGNAGIAFALAAVFAFSYMAHLLEQSRNRAQQYVSLSWGVLARPDALAGHP